VSHEPVLIDEILEYFSEIEIETFFDGTLGAGGHARAILEAHPEIKLYVGCDRDASALQLAKERVADPRLKCVHANFSIIDKTLEELGVENVDGVLLDLGVSSMQLDEEDRGFSFRARGPLDMRMDQGEIMTAKEIVNTWPEKKLGELFRDFGEEPRWRKAASTIVGARRKKKFETTKELADVLEKALGTPVRRKRRHPATLIFQALRMAVNRELEHVQEGIAKALHCLSKHGRMGVISFHSLEDRVAKNVFRDAAKAIDKSKKPLCRLLTKKPLVPKRAEIKRNPRARSSKLRFLERL